MSSSVPAALDYLAGRVAELDAVRQMRAVVSDGWPATRSDQMIVIGVTPDGDDVGVTVGWADLSRGQDHEDVLVPGVVAVRRAGRDAASRARADASALMDAIRELIWSDRRLGGAIEPGMPARIVRADLSQTSAAGPAGEGRTCEIRWTLTWQHRG